MELQSYNVCLVDGLGAWYVAASIWEAAAAGAPTGRETRTWEHWDGVITSTCRPPPALAIDAVATVCVYFEGECQKKLGSSGALAFTPDGRLLGAEACYHGELAPTSNQAEAQGMLLGLELGLAQRWDKAFSGLLAVGDSNLMVAFMQHRSRLGQQALVAAVTEARRHIKGARGRRVCFKHIPREQNCLAD